MKLPGRGAEADLVPWDRRYPVPVGGAVPGNSGHVDDHNAIATQLPELWERARALQKQIITLAVCVAGLAGLVTILGVLITLIMFHVI